MKLLSFLFIVVLIEANEVKNSYDPCCSFPCQQMGFCLSSGRKYECDCTGTGYYGKHCETPYFSTKLKQWIKPSKDSLHYFLSNFPYLWKVLNKIGWIRKTLMKILLKVRIGMVDEPTQFNGYKEFVTWDAYSNRSLYARSLPAVPLNCPTPLGVKGKKILPDVDLLAEKFLLRRNFQPCPRRTSLVFPLFAQHFTHQFFKTDFKKGFPYQWGDQTVDLSHVYGDSDERQHALRSHIDGKMKISIINNEAFPPTVANANVPMEGIDKVENEFRFAIGHPGFTLQPVLLFFSTIWLREHNRVCEVLKSEHPSWDDERLFQTARLILTGETLKIIVEDYVQHLSGYNFELLYDPELLHGSELSYHNRIHLEFQLLYHWHSLIPDYLDINNQTLKIRNILFNPKPFVQAGLSQWTYDATNQFASKAVGGQVQGQATLNVAKQAIRDGRNLRLQSFNRYRERFGMKPYKSFSEFIEDPKMANDLEKLYGDVDGLEFFIGIMLEKRRPPLVFGQTITDIGSPYSLKGIFGNPIGSAKWWKPSTFGGKIGFDIIKNTNLQSLICRNVEGCPNVSFEVQQGIKYESTAELKQHHDNSSDILMKLSRGHEVTDRLEHIDSNQVKSGKSNPYTDRVKMEL